MKETVVYEASAVQVLQTQKHDQCELSPERYEITHDKDTRKHNLMVVQEELQLQPYHSIANQIENV
jgi:hypothetical protein